MRISQISRLHWIDSTIKENLSFIELNGNSRFEKNIVILMPRGYERL
jgi:hypothetical protein